MQQSLTLLDNLTCVSSADYSLKKRRRTRGDVVTMLREARRHANMSKRLLDRTRGEPTDAFLYICVKMYPSDVRDNARQE